MKFKKDDYVMDKRFKEVHQIDLVLFQGKKIFYDVKNISGPGAYQGHEVWAEEDLMPCTVLKVCSQCASPTGKPITINGEVFCQRCSEKL